MEPEAAGGVFIPKEWPPHALLVFLPSSLFHALDSGSFSHIVSCVVRQRGASSAALFQALLQLHVDISYLYNILNSKASILEVLGGGGRPVPPCLQHGRGSQWSRGAGVAPQHPGIWHQHLRRWSEGPGEAHNRKDLFLERVVRH